MTITVPSRIEDRIRRWAQEHGRVLDAVVAEAIQAYLDAASITDLGEDDVAMAQLALLSELGPMDAWSPGSGSR